MKSGRRSRRWTLAGPLLTWGIPKLASPMPAKRRLRFIQNQPVRNANHPADRSGRKRILWVVRSERRAVRRHQPDKKSRRSCAGGSLVHCRVLCRSLIPSAKTLSSSWRAGLLESCPVDARADNPHTIAMQRQRWRRPIHAGRQLHHQVHRKMASVTAAAGPVELAEAAAWCCQCRAPASPPH